MTFFKSRFNELEPEKRSSILQRFSDRLTVYKGRLMHKEAAERFAAKHRKSQESEPDGDEDNDNRIDSSPETC